MLLSTYHCRPRNTLLTFFAFESKVFTVAIKAVGLVRVLAVVVWQVDTTLRTAVE